jgi:predicted transcriptional regulator
MDAVTIMLTDCIQKVLGEIALTNDVFLRYTRCIHAKDILEDAIARLDAESNNIRAKNIFK